MWVGEQKPTVVPNKMKMKNLIIAIAAITMFACTTSTSSNSCKDSTCTDSTICNDSLDLNDSITIKQVKQMDSLHKEGKL